MLRTANRKSPPPKPIDFSKYSSSALPDLRRLRNQEVDNLNFEEVRVIDAAIAILTDNTESTIETLTASLIQAVELAFAEYDRATGEVTTAANENAQAVREEANKKFADLRTNHIAELADLEDSRVLDAELQQRRPSARANELLKVAKELAKAQQIELAIETREEANRMKKTELEERAYAVNSSYEAKQNALIPQLLLELSQLENLLNGRLEAIEFRRTQSLESIRNATVSSLRKELRKTIASARSHLTKKEKVGEVTEMLINTVSKKITDDGRIGLFETPSP
jgi:hypothetical protein